LVLGHCKQEDISVADCQIAAIAAAHGFAVATRDTAPFIAAGVPVVNPWHQPRESSGLNIDRLICS
jgi:predicted nucleic acid-binding protein